MKFKDFENKVIDLPIINFGSLKNYFSNLSYLSRLISMWLNKKWLLKLKKGIYIINKPYYLSKANNYYISNNIYNPSYISLETALSFYNIIPERVETITAITTKKNQKISNELGNFIYHNIKKELFIGFNQLDIYGNKVFIASKEKSLFDLVYLNYFKFKDPNLFIDFYRLNNLDSIKKKEIIKYLKLIKNKVFEKFLLKLINKNDGYNQI